MTFGHFALALGASGDRKRDLLKLVAFLGRYGHQQATTVMQLPISEVMQLAEEVGNLIKEENDAMRARMETDGV